MCQLWPQETPPYQLAPKSQPSQPQSTAYHDLGELRIQHLSHTCFFLGTKSLGTWSLTSAPRVLSLAGRQTHGTVIKAAAEAGPEGVGAGVGPPPSLGHQVASRRGGGTAEQGHVASRVGSSWKEGRGARPSPAAPGPPGWPTAGLTLSTKQPVSIPLVFRVMSPAGLSAPQGHGDVHTFGCESRKSRLQ